MSMEHGEIRGEDPSSERWIQYYREARVRRRARGPELRTRVKLRTYRNRQRAMIVSGFLTVGVVGRDLLRRPHELSGPSARPPTLEGGRAGRHVDPVATVLTYEG